MNMHGAAIRSAAGLLAVALGTAVPAAASDQVVGQAVEFTGPKGAVERCVRVQPMPGGVYSKGDLKDEAAFCAIDFYAATVALCPKTWSTSAGMMVYDVSGGAYAGDRDGFQRNACAEGKSGGDLAADTLAKFKPTMNAKGTSGTFSTASLLYYHFSRYFDAVVHVPVAVWRSMDREMHLEEVASAGLALSGNSGSSRMNHEAWAILVAADKEPATYKPTDELFTADRAQLYGVLVTSPGHRYNAEINGTRKSGWGKGQSLDFQETAPFLALRSDQPLKAAIAEGIAKALKDAKLRKDTGDDATELQMVFWMRELSEIALLDFLFSQQDRVGNVDFVPYWYWVENGEVKHRSAKHHSKGESPPAPGAVLLKRSFLNDNDAGGRVSYANFTKQTGMLENLRHFDAGVYRQLLALDRDLQAQGPLWHYVKDSFGLDQPQLNQIVKNTAAAAAILRSACEAGKLRFDLDPQAFLLNGDAAAAAVDCKGS